VRFLIEWVLWEIASSLEHLVEEQVGIREELVQIQILSERCEDVLQDLVNQTKASSDVLELFTWESIS